MNAKAPETSTPDEALFDDPDFPWDGGRPYDVVNARLREKGHAALATDSSRDEVNKAGFALGGMSPAVRRAYDQLRKPPERIVLDFFHYQVPNLRIGHLDPAALERPMPVAQPDLTALAGCPAAPADFAPAPAQLPVYEVPLSGVIDFGLDEFLASPLCAAAPTLSDLIEVDNDQQ